MSLRGFAMLLLFMVSVPRADACSCLLQTGPVEQRIDQSLREADTVFVARLLRSTLKPDGQKSRMVCEDAQFEVLEVFKGSLQKGQIIRVYQVVSGGACGMSRTNDPMGSSRSGGRAGLKNALSCGTFRAGAAPASPSLYPPHSLSRYPCSSPISRSASTAPCS